MRDNEKKNVNLELQDVKEFTEMYSQLTDDEKLQLRGIVIGLKLAQQKPEVTPA